MNKWSNDNYKIHQPQSAHDNSLYFDSRCQNWIPVGGRARSFSSIGKRHRFQRISPWDESLWLKARAELLKWNSSLLLSRWSFQSLPVLSRLPESKHHENVFYLKRSRRRRRLLSVRLFFCCLFLWWWSTGRVKWSTFAFQLRTHSSLQLSEVDLRLFLCSLEHLDRISEAESFCC